MPATRRPTSSDQHHQYVLILSHDPLAAALLGGLVETLGYEVYGEPFVEVNIPHVHMRRSLNEARRSGPGGR